MAKIKQPEIPPNLVVTVTDKKGAPIPSASVTLKRAGGGSIAPMTTDSGGVLRTSQPPGTYSITCDAALYGKSPSERIEIPIRGVLNLTVELEDAGDELAGIMMELDPENPTEGDVMKLTALPLITTKDPIDPDAFDYEWTITDEKNITETLRNGRKATAYWSTRGRPEGTYVVSVALIDRDTASPIATADTSIYLKVAMVPPDPVVPVSLRRTSVSPTEDQALWAVIRSSTAALGFNAYKEFIDPIMCQNSEVGAGRAYKEKIETVRAETSLPFPRVDGYKLLKAATEVFLSVQCGVMPNDMEFNRTFNLTEENRRFNRTLGNGEIETMWSKYLTPVRDGYPERTIPYLDLIQDKLGELPLRSGSTLGNDCYGLLREKLTNPCFLELVWSYWHEEGLLVQTMNAISLRFQNRRSSYGEHDPLAQFELDPLRPLNNILWGYIQDEQHRLTIPRRAYEYDHHYGLTLFGKAVPKLRSAESRSKFLEAFHNLMQRCSAFLERDDDTTVIADGFPVLNALKDVHMLLTQGMHNQYGDLPWTARHEMLMQQWILSRPEMREFLPSRVMVAYPEAWMDRVETMKRLQGWDDLSVTHFRDLGVFGEQILLSIRFGAWSKVNEPDQASNWIRYWRPEIQGYVHSYRSITGVDLTADSVDTRRAAERYLPPAVHIQNRMARVPMPSKVPVNGQG